MKKKFTLLSFLIVWIGINSICWGQIQPMGFTQKIVTPPSDRFVATYRPKLKLWDDTLYVCSNTGIYRKNIQESSTSWELYAFENIPIIEFVKNGNNLLAISPGTKDGKDSLLLLSPDNGKTVIDYTSPHFLEYQFNYLSRIAQNPQNPASILILHINSGVSKSDDFGRHWTGLTDIGFGSQNRYIGFHPTDTATLFYMGESDSFSGMIYKSGNNGTAWSEYLHPGGDNCIHDIAYHPTNSNLLVYSGEMTMGKSTNKGETWGVTNLQSSGMYFYRVLFDEENPDRLYSSGTDRGNFDINDTIRIYRSIDKGNSWHLAYNEGLNESCGGVYDMIKYKNKLILYTRDCGLFELDLETSPVVSVSEIEYQPELTIFPNREQGIIQFETDALISQVEIFDLTGRLLQQIPISSGERQITISRLTSGMYVAVFHTSERHVTKKFRW